MTKELWGKAVWPYELCFGKRNVHIEHVPKFHKYRETVVPLFVNVAIQLGELGHTFVWLGDIGRRQEAILECSGNHMGGILRL